MANIVTTEGERVTARYLRHVRKDKHRQKKYLPKSKSLKAASGGLPTLGKRH